MTRKSVLITLVSLLTLVVSVAAVTARGPLAPNEASPQVALGNAFTYQGRLLDGGSPATGAYDIQFDLYDAATVGNLVGTVTLLGVAVTDGLFTVQLDFGGSAFTGDARWLEISVEATTLAPRQEITAAPYAQHALSAPGGEGWALTGNAGTDPTTNFLGTTDSIALEFRVNSVRALRLEPTTNSPNLIGGYSGNSVTSGAVGATISGGGVSGGTNLVTDNHGTVGGGQINQARDNAGTKSDAAFATVGGGRGNTANGYAATISGGDTNAASDNYATVGGGGANTASADYATVSGGRSNTAIWQHATIGGGQGNTASGDFASVGGGLLQPRFR